MNKREAKRVIVDTVITFIQHDLIAQKCCAFDDDDLSTADEERLLAAANDLVHELDFRYCRGGQGGK